MRGIWSRPTAKGEIEGDLVQAHTQGGRWGGSGPGPHPRGKLRGICSRPIAKREVEGIWLGERCLLQRDQTSPPQDQKQTPPGPKADSTLDQKQTPPSIWSMSGRYASYWNAFLFSLLSSIVSRASQSKVSNELLEFILFLQTSYIFEIVNFKK